MKLENRTRAPALLYRGGVDESRLFGSVFARVTYDLRGGELVPAREQVWEVSPGPWEGPHGPMDADEVFYRGGVDVMVFGAARPPGGRAAPWVEVSVEVGKAFRQVLWVFGPRRWVRTHRGLEQTEPTPFEAIPLTLEHAFGGTDSWDGLEVPFPANPQGTGFYLTEESAENGLLPCIEDPDARIAAWEDRPEPKGIGATSMAFGPRVQRSVRFDEGSGRLSELKPTFFNSAFPDMVVPTPEPGEPAVRPGEVVTVQGVRPEGPLHFTVPPCPFRVELRFEDEVIERTLAVDQIGIEPDHDRVFVAWRYPFRYKLIPLQRRACILHPEDERLTGPAPGDGDEGRRDEVGAGVPTGGSSRRREER